MMNHERIRADLIARMIDREEMDIMTHDIESSDSAFESISLPEIAALEKSGTCPRCGEEMDSGAGFGKRDLECSECDFFLSYPLSIFLDQHAK